jgi:hypothetical protein
VLVEDSVGLLTISAVYLPPRHTVKQEQFKDFYNILGGRFIAGGDYNAKHTDWGSRLISFKGCELFKTMESMNLKYLSTGEPTYWPSDSNKLPDLVDFGVAKSCFIFRSFPDLDYTADAVNHENEPILSYRHTNWDDFRYLVNKTLTLNIPLKTEEDIEAAAKFFNDTIQWAGWNATLEHKRALKAYNCPIKIKQKIEEK